MPSIAYSQDFNVNDGAPDNSANMTRSTTTVYEGAGSIRLNPTAAAAFWLKNAVGSPTVIVMRCWVRFASLPTADVEFLNSTDQGGIWYVQASTKFACFTFGGGTAAVGGPTIVTGVWYRLDTKIDDTNNLVDGMVDGTALTQASGAVGALSDYRFGTSFQSATWDGFFDKVDVSHTAADYPFPSAVVSWMTA